MSDHLRQALRRAILRLLDPLTRLMLEVGIGAGEFQRLAKDSYVRSARQMLGTERANYSRIAVQTGLTRAEVTNILNAQEAAGDPETYLPRMEASIGAARAERVLNAWWTDSDFHYGVGRPAILPLSGQRKSFQSLVAKHAGGFKARSVLHELLRVKAVRLLPDKKVEALTRTTTNVKWDEEGVQEVGERVRDLLETLAFNLKNPMKPRFVRFVMQRTVDPKYLPMLRRDLISSADTNAYSMEEMLNFDQMNVSPGRKPQEAVRLGVGIFLIEEPTIVPPKAATRRTKRRS